VDAILVCVGPSPASQRLIRAGQRMAAGLRAPWAAVHVAAGGRALGAEEGARLEEHLRLAESLGGEVVRLAAPRPAAAILEYARRHQVAHIIAGKPTRSRLRDLLGGSFVDELVRASGHIDVHVISGDAGPPSLPPLQRERGRRVGARARVSAYLGSALLIGVTTAVALGLQTLLRLPDPEMLYLLAIMAAAVWLGRGPSVLAAALSVGAYDFFFVEPLHTFTVAEWRYLLTFLMMFIVGLLISTLTIRLRQRGQEASARAERTAVLYALSRDLAAAVDVRQIAEVGARHVLEALRAPAVVLLAEDGVLAPRAAAPRDTELAAADQAVARRALELGRPAGRGTEVMADVRCHAVPLGSAPDVLGVLAVVPEAAAGIAAEQQHFLAALARQLTVALERARLADEARAVAVRARTEELRSALLSAVSHDLRTPLATITGSATAIRDEAGLSEAVRAELIQSVCDEAERLERLVSNLLEMTKLQSGAAEVRREWVPLEEIVGAALTRLEARLQDREIEVKLAADLPLVPVDPILIQQVLINLLDNASKYTPAGTAIEIGAAAGARAVEMTVADRGPGFPPGAEERLFERFQRGDHPGVAGAGLGLAICRGMVEAHGGTIRAENQAGGGARFRIVLPIVGTPPAPPPEEEAARDP
jgi:two-component system, OmpR family, sensor histidine kinase KdpD